MRENRYLACSSFLGFFFSSSCPLPAYFPGKNLKCLLGMYLKARRAPAKEPTILDNYLIQQEKALSKQEAGWTMLSIPLLQRAIYLVLTTYGQFF